MCTYNPGTVRRVCTAPQLRPRDWDRGLGWESGGEAGSRGPAQHLPGNEVPFKIGTFPLGHEDFEPLLPVRGWGVEWGTPVAPAEGSCDGQMQACSLPHCARRDDHTEAL